MKKIKKVHVLTANLTDSQNMRFSKECLEKLQKDLENKELPVLLDFDHDKEVGKSSNFEVGGDKLLCNVEILEEIKDGEFYPAIQGKLNKQIKGEKSLVEVHEFQLLGISICEGKNVDPSIPPIRIKNDHHEYFNVEGAGEIRFGKDINWQCGKAKGFGFSVSWTKYKFAGGVIDKKEALKLADFIYEKLGKKK